jgi:GTP-binding protein
VTKILDLAKRAYAARHKRIPTSELNRFFEEYVAEPRATGGRHRVRVQFLTQAATDPPTFVVFLSSQKEKLHFSLERYIENRLREQFEFFATPIKIKQRTKG